MILTKYIGNYCFRPDISTYVNVVKLKFYNFKNDVGIFRNRNISDSILYYYYYNYLFTLLNCARELKVDHKIGLDINPLIGCTVFSGIEHII